MYIFVLNHGTQALYQYCLFCFLHNPLIRLAAPRRSSPDMSPRIDSGVGLTHCNISSTPTGLGNQDRIYCFCQRTMDKIQAKFRHSGPRRILFALKVVDVFRRSKSSRPQFLLYFSYPAKMCSQPCSNGFRFSILHFLLPGKVSFLFGNFARTLCVIVKSRDVKSTPPHRVIIRRGTS